MQKNYRKLALLFTSLLLLFSTISDAATVRWIAGAGTGDWNNVSNWEIYNGNTASGVNQIPTSNDIAIFPASGGNPVTVTGTAAPDVGAIWVFNNGDVTLDLDLNVIGTPLVGTAVRVFNGSMLTFGPGRNFNISATGGAISFWVPNGTVNIGAGATVTLAAPRGIVSRSQATTGTLNNFGTLVFNTTTAGIQVNNASSIDFINHPCATMELGTTPIRLWGTPGVKTLTNNGLITHTGSGGPRITVTTGNAATNNGFYDYADPTVPFSNGSAYPAGLPNDFGINVNDPGVLMFDAMMTCDIADLGINTTTDWFLDAANTMPAGSNAANGMFNIMAVLNAGTNTLYSCHSTPIEITIDNVMGDCVPAPCFPGIACPANTTIGCMDSTDPADTGEPVITDDCDCVSTPMPSAWINEFHYNNTGSDAGEFFEIAGTAGFDLSTCVLVRYNGANGNAYSSGGTTNPIPLVGMIDDEGNGFGAVDFQLPLNGLQNGPDGMALVCMGNVVEFISYEGSFMANDGPAMGMTSIDIGVSEVPGGPTGVSVQLTGAGTMSSDFSWTGPITASPGTLNAGQTIPTNDITVTFADVSTQTATGCTSGSYTITRTFTATNLCGNASTCEQVITVEDTTPPMAVCNDIGVTTDAMGNYTLTPADIAAIGAGTTDDCSGVDFASATVSPSMFTNANAGANLVTYTVSDNCGNASTCSATVTVTPACSLVLDCSLITDQPLECRSDLPPVDFDLLVVTDSCGDVTKSALTIIPGNSGCPGDPVIVTREYFGNDGVTGESCMQTFTIESTMPPTITCPADVTLQCDADMSPAATGMATGTASCSNYSVAISFSDMSTQTTTGCSASSYTITRTWSATDDCNRVTTCDQIITVEDTTPPVITCPADVTVECDQPTDPSATGNATASGDNCAADSELTITFADVSTQGMNCANNTYMITRTWTASDPCGNATTCDQIITVQDNTAPSITCPADVTIQCDESTIPGTSSAGTTTGAAGTNSLTWTDATSGFIGDVTAVVAGIPAGATVTDINLMLDIDHSFVGDLNLTLTSPNGTAVNFLDNSGSFADNVSVIFDDEGAAYATVASSSDVGTPDDCSNDYLGGSTIAGTLQPEQNNFMVFDGTPAGGNWVLSVTDDAGGDGGCLINYSVEVAWELVAGGTTGSATAMDNCAPQDDIAITFTDATTQTATGCGQYNYVITRTWTATDPCGNATTCDQIITVEDTTAPVITCPADVTGSCTDSTLPADTGMATAMDNCSADSEVVITFADATTQTPDGCGQFTFVITRTWTATDACGNSADCVQTISIADTDAPTISCPADQMLACDTDPLPVANTIADFIAIGGSAVDNCSSLDELTISFTDFPSAQSMLNFCPGTSEADRTLTRTYTITDVCGNASTCEQLFIYEESQVGPVITAVPPNQTVDCAVNAFPQLGLFTAEGDCSNITYSVSGPSNAGTLGCPGSTIQYTYTATDGCGRMASHIQTYTLANDGPEFVCPADICVIECPADTDMIQAQFDSYASLATVISSCSESNITIGNNFNPNGFIPQNCMNPTVAVPGAVSYQVVRFTATDACGRNGTCTALVVIKDSDGPVMNNTIPVGMADCNDANLQQGYTAWATNQLNNLTATDECGGGTVTFSYAPLTANTDCSSGLASTEVSFIATDPCGNETIQTSFYRIIDNGTGEPAMATVSGNLLTEEDEMIALANVEADGFMNSNIMTNDDGYYHFDLMTAQNYSIAPSRNDDPMNGITTYDLILLGRHILEINLLDSPYKMIAADVNESGHISSLDMIELRRLILQIDDEFSSGKSWTFVDAGYVFPNPSNPFATTYPTAANINNLVSSQVIDFIGVKLGDLNASANVNSLQAGDTRSSDGNLKIKLEDQQLKAGQTYDLAFKASDFKNVEGFQFTLDFAAESLELLDYQNSDLTSMSVNNFGFTKANEGKITVSWNETTGINMADDATLFQISFTALEAGQLSDVLAINSSLTTNEAYQASLRKDVVLDFGNTISNEKEFALLQNQPNPFSQETVIGFQLPEATDATLTIFGAAGRVVFTQTKSYEPGLHQVMMNKADLGITGVFYYQLSTGKQTATKKMIVLK